jgi:hypothetical protein
VSRLLALVGLVALLLAGLAAVVGTLAYGNEPVREGRLTLDALRQPTAVSWNADGHVVIEATNEADLAAALGYAHAADDAWAMTLWRRAALGGLAGWFGPTHNALDRHARMLGFADLARLTYEALPPEDRAVLDAYAEGVNLALRQNPVAQRDEFVLLDLSPMPWAPWHALAVERLVAWLGTPPLSADSVFAAARSDAAVERFASTDSLFRRTLGLGGAHQSRAWAAQLGSGTAFVQQHPYGTSALPLLRTVTLRQGSRSVSVATVPGTLMMPGGQSDAHAWSLFLTSDAALAPFDADLPPPVFDRIADDDGNETLLTINRAPDGLYFKSEVATPPTVQIDSLAADSTGRMPDTIPPKAPAAWVLRWPGFATGTDLGAWRALRNREPSAFRLFRGDGLLMTQGDGVRVLGAPSVRVALPGGVFLAADPQARFAGESLAERLGRADSSAAQDSLTVESLARDAYSGWAAAQLPGLLAALGHRDSLAADLKDPYAFLLSWDARYTEDAIGASLFETWLVAHRSITGALPSAADSSNRPLLQQTLRLSVAILRDHYGERTSGWRWEYVQPGARVFPVWGDSARGPAASRYAPLKAGLGGHPTALRAGPSLVFGEPPAPAVWTAWMTTDDWTLLHVFHPVVEPEGFLARLRTTRAAAPVSVRLNEAVTDPLFLRPRS